MHRMSDRKQMRRRKVIPVPGRAKKPKNQHSNYSSPNFPNKRRVLIHVVGKPTSRNPKGRLKSDLEGLWVATGWQKYRITLRKVNPRTNKPVWERGPSSLVFHRCSYDELERWLSEGAIKIIGELKDFEGE